VKLFNNHQWIEWALVGVLLLVGASPVIAALLPDCAVRDAMNFWFSRQCHQLPDRAIPLDCALPVCARCAGLYFGLIPGLLLRRVPISRAALLIWFGAGSLLLGMLVLFAQGTQLDTWPVRLLSGLAVSMPLGMFSRYLRD